MPFACRIAEAKTGLCASDPYEGDRRMGDLPNGRPTEGIDPAALLEEFERIVKAENVTHLSEGPPDVEKKIQFWRDILANGPPK